MALRKKEKTNIHTRDRSFVLNSTRENCVFFQQCPLCAMCNFNCILRTISSFYMCIQVQTIFFSFPFFRSAHSFILLQSPLITCLLAVCSFTLLSWIWNECLQNNFTYEFLHSCASHCDNSHINSWICPIVCWECKNDMMWLQ